MNTKLSLVAASLTLGMATSNLALAEQTQYSCSYTDASYTAPFMQGAKTRACPQGRCNYDIVINKNMALVNGVSGYAVEQSEQSIKLSRTAKDPVMGGMDSTVLTINKQDLSFQSVKTTTPSVVLTTQGSCSK